MKVTVNGSQAWIATTKAQKLAWMAAEEGSWEDNGRSRGHVYDHIRGSYWSSLHVNHNNVEKLVLSLLSCTLDEVNPRIWRAFVEAFIVVCEQLQPRIDYKPLVYIDDLLGILRTTLRNR